MRRYSYCRTFRVLTAPLFTSHDIMIATLGCKVYTAKVQEKDKLVEKTFIQLPSIDESTDEGRQHRKRLLRLWLETGIWLEDHYKRYRACQCLSRRRSRTLTASTPPAADHLERKPTRIRLKENTKEVLAGMLGGDKRTCRSLASHA